MWAPAPNSDFGTAPRLVGKVGTKTNGRRAEGERRGGNAFPPVCGLKSIPANFWEQSPVQTHPEELWACLGDRNLSAGERMFKQALLPRESLSQNDA